MAEDTVSCGTHGDARATFVCRHLAHKPAQRWCSFKPDKRHPFPDAWCTRCDALYQRQAGWPDDGEEPPLAIVCHHCYIAGRNASAHSLSGRALDNWDAFIHAAIKDLKAKQERLTTSYGLSRHERFDWSQATGKTSGTWPRSWANTSHLPRMRKPAGTMLELGELLDFRKLTTPLWKADEVDGWEMAAATALLLGSPGVYRSASERGTSLLLIKRIRHA